MAGALGLVGWELLPILRDKGNEVRAKDLPFFDLRYRDSVRNQILQFRPDWVVNLAAFTAVDDCETNVDAARQANSKGALHIAEAANEAGARLLQVSTDYVYDGTKPDSYTEEDEPSPLSEYGRSKLEGEAAVRASLPEGRWLIVRGQSLYGFGRKSFPDAILKAAESSKQIPVVVDQTVSPTWAREFARGLEALIRADARGLYLLSSSGSCTWNEFARAVIDMAGVQGVEVTETTAEALGRPARRPARSVFALDKFVSTTGVSPPHWRDQLQAYLRETWRAA